ncbi:MAG UNVERIFIED_CONTAM: hypothetical protein LVT10_04230 [Anaerolineae bacterium]
MQQILKQMNQPAFRAKQIHEWLYQRFATSFDDMTNLPKPCGIPFSNGYTSAC